MGELTAQEMSRQVPWLVIQTRIQSPRSKYSQLMAAFRDYQEATKYANRLVNAKVQLMPGLAEQEKKRSK